MKWLCHLALAGALLLGIDSGLQVQAQTYQSLGAASLAVTNTTGNVALPAGTFGNNVTIQNVGTVEAFIVLGVGSGTAATTSGESVPAGAGRCFQLNGQTYLAAITSASTTTLRVGQGSGPCSVSFRGGGSVTVGAAVSGGTDTRVLFDDAGTVGEDGGLTYAKSTDALTVAGSVNLGAGPSILTSPTAASTQLGAADVDTNASIVAQVLRTQGALTGGTSNQAGKNLTVIISPGKGTGTGGSFIVQTTPAGGSGTTVGTPTTAMTIDSTQLVTLAVALTVAGANVKFTALGNASTTSAVCYNTGTGLLTYNSTVGTCTVSALEAKTNIVPLAAREGYEMVMEMEPKRYTMKEGRPTYVRGEQIGFIADWVRDDRLVAHNPDGKVAGMRYEQYTAALTAAIQYMDARLAKLEAANDNLRTELLMKRASSQ